MSILLPRSAYAQTSTTQSVTVSVGTVYRITVSGSPAAMNISAGTAGTDALTPVTDASTTYSITQNFGNTVKITANLDVVLSAGYTLKVTLVSTIVDIRHIKIFFMPSSLSFDLLMLRCNL